MITKLPILRIWHWAMAPLWKSWSRRYVNDAMATKDLINSSDIASGGTAVAYFYSNYDANCDIAFSSSPKSNRP